MSIRDSALAAAVLKVLADEIAERLQAAKAEAAAGFRDTGTTQSVPVLSDGTKVATVSLAGEGSPSASVTDPGKFLAWVQETHPGETEVIVREGYRKKLLDFAKAEGRAVDPATGEEVPGITVGQSRGYVSVRLKAGGQDAIVSAWRSGELKGIEVVRPAAVEGGAS